MSCCDLHNALPIASGICGTTALPNLAKSVCTDWEPHQPLDPLGVQLTTAHTDFLLPFDFITGERSVPLPCCAAAVAYCAGGTPSAVRLVSSFVSLDMLSLNCASVGVGNNPDPISVVVRPNVGSRDTVPFCIKPDLGQVIEKLCEPSP